MVKEQGWKYTWRVKSSKSGDTLGGRDIVSTLMYEEVVIEGVRRYPLGGHN
jgi:hypothetical protein